MSSGLLPDWLAIAWVVALSLVFAAHCLPLLAGAGRRRVWHALHLAIAVAMAAMYASASILSISMAGPGWTAGCLTAALIATVMLAGDVGRRRAIDVLWPLTILDLITMAYMLRSGRPIPVISWLLVAGLIAQVALWATGAGGRLAELAHSGPGAHSGPITAREPAVRSALMVMAAGMAYMLAVMQLSA